MSRARVLEPGVSCEAIAAVEQTGVLVDAQDYYRAVYDAVLRAERYVLVAGWQFDSAVPLLRGLDAERAEAPVTLLALLEHAVRSKPELECYLLAWDHSLLFALEREWLQRLKFDAISHERVHFVFDSQHPSGASHHQKLVVVDGAVAFAGGIDLCDARWDDRRHAAVNPDRVLVHGGDPQKPYHDMMGYCVGPAVSELTRLFCLRWQRTTGVELALPPVTSAQPLPPLRGALPIASSEIGISLTFGEHALSDTRKCEQVKQLFERAIAGAERLIYIETQYFTSHAIHDALSRRMRDGGPLEIVAVMPHGADTPKEKFALGSAQRWVQSSLCACAREHGHELRLLYSVVDGADRDGAGGEAGDDDCKKELATFIHSKLLAIDDRLLTVGSANLTNRSMSLDSELNFVWENAALDDATARSIARVRASLLCEHAGIPYDPELERCQGLVARLDRLIGIGKSKLRLCEVPDSPEQVERDPLLERAFDPDKSLTDLELDDLFEPRGD